MILPIEFTNIDCAQLSRKLPHGLPMKIFHGKTSKVNSVAFLPTAEIFEGLEGV